MPDYLEYQAYAHWNLERSRVLACAQCMVFHTGDNEHATELRVEVLPEFRHRGLAKQALRQLLPFIQKQRRSLLITFASDHMADTTRWLERLGGRRGLTMRVSQLKVSEFDRGRLTQWLKRSVEDQTQFEVCFIHGLYPDRILDEICALFQLVGNDAPASRWIWKT